MSVKNVLIPVRIPEKNDEIAFHVSEKNVLTFVQTVSQSVPNQPRTVSAREVNVLIQFSKVATTKSQTAPKTSWTPCHTISQSPVKIPAKMSNRPVRMSRASLRILLICWNTPSKIGASTSQKPSQTAFITSVMSSNSNPSALSLSTIPCPNSSNLALIPSQIAVILFLNSSLFFHKFVKARATAVITAIIAIAGSDTPPSAAASFTSAPFTIAILLDMVPQFIAAITAPRPLTAMVTSGICPPSHSIAGITPLVINCTPARSLLSSAS